MLIPDNLRRNNLGDPMAATIRTISLFVMHSREADHLTQYAGFFDWMIELPRRLTRVQVRSDLVLVIERARKRDGLYEFTFISGDPSEIPLIFNEETGSVEKAPNSEETWPVRQTAVIVDPETRLVGIENRRAGVGSTNLERYFRILARDQGYASDLLFDLAGQPSASFEQELNDFDRIREATVVIKRPNNDWEDAEDVVADLADATGAHTASVTVNAARGASLNSNDGLLSVIRRQVQRPQTSISNVRVIGTRNGETQERSLSLARHQVKGEVRIPRNASRSEEREAVWVAAVALIQATAQTLGLTR